MSGAENFKVAFLCRVSGISGAEKYILEIMPSLNKMVRVEMICVFDPKDEERVKPFIQHLENNKVKVHSISSGPVLSRALLKRINAIIKSEKIDILHTHLIHADIWGGLIHLFMNRKVSVVSTKHGYQDIYGEDYLRLEKLKKNNFYWSARFAERFIANT